MFILSSLICHNIYLLIYTLTGYSEARHEWGGDEVLHTGRSLPHKLTWPVVLVEWDPWIAVLPW